MLVCFTRQPEDLGYPCVLIIPAGQQMSEVVKADHGEQNKPSSATGAEGVVHRGGRSGIDFGILRRDVSAVFARSGWLSRTAKTTETFECFCSLQL